MPKEYSKLWKKVTFWLAFKGGHREKRIHGQATEKIDKSYRRLSDGFIGHVCFFKLQASGIIRTNHQFNIEYCSIIFQSDHDGKVI